MATVLAALIGLLGVYLNARKGASDQRERSVEQRGEKLEPAGDQVARPPARQPEGVGGDPARKKQPKPGVPVSKAPPNHSTVITSPDPVAASGLQGANKASPTPPARNEVSMDGVRSGDTGVSSPLLQQCSGFDPLLKLEGLSVSAIKEGYSLVFRVRNMSGASIAINTIRTNELRDDKKNDLALRQTNLPEVYCNPPEACAGDTFKNGIRLEQGANASITYKFLGLVDHHGTRVSVADNILITRPSAEGSYITTRAALACEDIPLAK